MFELLIQLPIYAWDFMVDLAYMDIKILYTVVFIIFVGYCIIFIILISLLYYTKSSNYIDKLNTESSTKEEMAELKGINWIQKLLTFMLIPRIIQKITERDLRTIVKSKMRPVLFWALFWGAIVIFLPSFSESFKPIADVTQRTFRECPECPEMVVVPAGTFLMGSPAGEGLKDERPQHEVTIDYRFAVGRYEVTFDEWDDCYIVKGCAKYPHDGRINKEGKNKSSWGRGKRPVINVRWQDAKEYVAWLSKKTGATYRLLTEAEWEYAARAGTTTARYWGDGIGGNNANCDGCVGGWDDAQRTAPVGSFPANAFGLHDMLGNVWEWVEDCWHENYENAPTDGRAWTTAGYCPGRVFRGGSWGHRHEIVYSARRGWGNVNKKIRQDEFKGFRVARTLD